MQQNKLTLVLTGQDIERIIFKLGIDEVMDQLIHRMHDAFLNFDKSNILSPIRSGFNYESPRTGLIEWMPLRNISQDEIFMKIVGYHPSNPSDFHLPTILSNFSTYDSRTGHLKSILDGNLLTALRTGAASSVATKLFANPNSKILGLIGCGAQAVTQLHAISRMFDLEKVMYFDIDSRCTQDFKDRMQGFDLDFEISSIDEIVSSSDILCTATSIKKDEGPLFETYDVKDHLHINAVGSDFPGKIELPKSLLEKSFVCPDFLIQARNEGECQQLETDQIDQELVDCLKNANKLSHLKNELTVFDSTGMPLEDKVVSEMFLEYAEKFNIGERILFETTNPNEKNPYAFLNIAKGAFVKSDQ